MVTCKQKAEKPLSALFLRSHFSRDDWIRTSDHMTPSHVRYRAALRPAPVFGTANIVQKCCTVKPLEFDR